MTAPEVDVRALPVKSSGRSPPVYWGMWGLMVVEATVFASLLSSYFYLHLVASEWPPAGVKPPELLLPTVNTVILLASGYFVHRADAGIREGDTRWLKLGLAAGIVLALAFLVIKVVEYGGLDYRWDSHVYGSIVWTITAFHTAHVVALVLKTAVVEVLAFRGYFDADRNIGVQVNGLYWNFVVAVWIPIYAALYFAPRLLD
jgi:cytochrome c oxidase subunit III